MSGKTRAMAEHVVELMDRSKRPRNQIATISGLTNTYIRDLERGQIYNVPREKLIAFATALNLDLNEIDTMLTVFDRAQLTARDIATFIDTASRGEISGALLPVRDMYAYELIVLSAEMIPGRQIIVSDRPTLCLLEDGHRSHSDRSLLAIHPIYGKLIEAIGRERRQNFHRLLEHHFVELYICKQCLEDYLRPDIDREELKWRTRHAAALLAAIKSSANLNVYLTRMCTNFNFTLKLPAKPEAPQKIFFSARAPHDMQRDRQGRLTGFATENPIVIQNFKDELGAIKKTVIEDYHDHRQLAHYLEALLEAVPEPKRKVTHGRR